MRTFLFRADSPAALCLGPATALVPVFALALAIQGAFLAAPGPLQSAEEPPEPEAIVDLALDPAEGPLTGGYPGSISGSGLEGATGILVGGRPARMVLALPDRLDFVVPPGQPPSGPVPVDILFAGRSARLATPFVYQNRAPVAVAIRPPLTGYRHLVGVPLLLDGGASFDPDEAVGDRLRCEWDLDDDGDFDREGPWVLLLPAELESFGLEEVGDHRVMLRVADAEGASAEAPVVVTTVERPRTFPSEDYRGWQWDANGNGIDDRIEARSFAEVVDVVIIFEFGSDLEAAMERLEALAPKARELLPSITTICLKGVPVGLVRLLDTLELDIFRVEEQETFDASLDVSAAAVRAGSCALYSPQTARDLGFTGAGVNIAFLDSGVDDDHPALAGKFVAGFDAFVDPFFSTGLTNPDDDFSFGGVFHGTHAAGIACGCDRIYGGVASGAKLVDVKVLDALGQGTTQSLLRGLQWCIQNRDRAWVGQPPEHHGIQVVNLSFNSRLRSDGRDSVSMMVDAAVASGIVVVASTGNSSGSGPGFGSPGAADGAITVGAVDDRGTVDRTDDVRVESSNHGPRASDGDLDPYDEMKPDVMAPGKGIASPVGNVGGTPPGGFTEIGGSSIAAAHVSGIVALILEASRDLDPASIKRILRSTAEPRGAPDEPFLDPTWNALHGCGIVDAYRALPADLGVGDRVWVASLKSDRLSGIVPGLPGYSESRNLGGSPFPVAGGREPHGIAVDGVGGVWLANRKTASVARFTAEGQPRFHVPLASAFGASPDVDVGAIAVDRENDAWVTLTSRNLVGEIRSDGIPLATYATGAAPVAVAVDREGSVWVASSGGGSVTKLLATGVAAPGSPYPVGADPQAIVCDRAGRAYVANRGSDTVSVLEPDGSLAGTWAAGRRPVEIVLDFLGRPWLSNDGFASVTRLDPDGSNPTTFEVGPGPRGISVGGDGSIWVSSFTIGFGTTVFRLRPSDGEILERVSVPVAPLNRGDGTGFVHASAVDPDGDADGDLWTNAEEIDASTNPLDPRSSPLGLEGVFPDAASVNGGSIVEILGRGLDASVRVLFGGVEAVVVGLEEEGISVRLPAGPFPPEGAVDVTVSRADGTTGALSGAFTYLNDPPSADPDPDDPDDGYEIAPGFTVTLDPSASSDPNEPLGDAIVAYEWSINGIALSGERPTVTMDDAARYGIGVPGRYVVTLRVTDSLGAESLGKTFIEVLPSRWKPFVRGRVNDDRDVDIADAIYHLQWLYTGGPVPRCLDAADVNDDGEHDLSDAIFLVTYLFLGGAEIPAPYPRCDLVPGPFGCRETTCP